MQKNKTLMLQEANKTISVLKSISNVSDILNNEEKINLHTLSEKFEDWNDRLLDERYRVAIIGTEKAGKSTFANALLRRDFLPEDEGRCTFTTTTIESSTQDSAKVEFFTKEEFLNKFYSLCKEIEFECNYEKVTLEELEDFCQTVSSAVATSNAVDDLRDIIAKKNDIEIYLSRPIEIFQDEEIDKMKSYITDEVKARAVKNITIQSTQFKEKENLIIYDVPGFDSPTNLHLEQAKWYMRNADIVIMLVSLADRISFVKSQADFLNETKDRYGQKLSNKLIVVASKFDKHIVDDKEASDEKIKKSYDLLIKELKKFNLYKQNNLFLASSLGFLEKEGIVSTKYAYPNLSKHNYNDGLDKIEARLEEFLSGEALEILNENFQIDNAEVVNFVLNFKKKHNPSKDERKKRSEEIQLIDTKWDVIKEQLKSSLTDYQQLIKETSFEFDNHIAQKVSDLWINELKQTLTEELKKAKSDIVSGRADVVQATKINEKIRENIYKKSLEKIVHISTDTITIETTQQKDTLVQAIAKILFDNQHIDVTLFDELYAIINNISENFQYDAKSYRPLILRFLNAIFELLILNRITHDEKETRVARFQLLRADIESLLNYDNRYDDSLGFYEQPLIQQILIQNTNYQLKQSTITSLLKGATIASTETEVLQEIEKDLDAIGEIFNTVLLKAIEIESPFKASLNDQIQAILNDVNENSKSKLKSFLVEHIETIATQEYARLEIDQKLATQLREIIEQIENL